jgi:hypothetical protein
VIKLAAQLVPVKVNAEKEGKDLAKKYKVQGFPTILFLDSKGTVMGQIGGYMPPDPFHDEMQKAISSHRDFPKVEATLKTKPNDGWANAKMASICAMRGDQPGAEKALKLAEAAKYQGPEMAQAYNAVGDLHQSARRFPVAIVHFEKAFAATSDAGVRSYALVSIMYCHLGNQDTASAKKAAKRLVDLKGASPEYVKMAQDVLKMPG